MTPDLHALANARGYGTAQAALRKAGCWDDATGDGPPRRFHVILHAQRAVTAEVFVDAVDAAEAEELASDMAVLGQVRWTDCDEPVEDVEAVANATKECAA